jgi:eukaryotic-like serine/threonine-protein kinase
MAGLVDARAMADASIELPEGAIARAARTLIRHGGGDATLADVLHSRALQHHTEGLRDYLCLRLGSFERGIAALDALKAKVAASGAELLAAAPGIRARLYQAAREIAAAMPPVPDAQAELVYLSEGNAHLGQELLASIRHEIDPTLRELMELRHVRSLSPREIAFVTGLSVESIFENLDRGAAIVRRIHGEGRLLPLRQILRDAFALAFAPTAQEGESTLVSGSIVGGRYAVERRVGVGSFGDVYRATDTEVENHVVALKLLHQPAIGDAARQAALKELRSIASVFHPSIVQFKDHGWHEGRLWFVMPWYEGETLAERIERKPLDRREARRIFQPLAEALDAMHAAGIRHQDVKPENIFLAELPGFGEGSALPILLDLGVAAKEAEMVVAGTPTYFAPEVAAQFAQAEVRPPLSPKADVFSLALSLRNALEPEGKEEIPEDEVEAFIAARAVERLRSPKSRELRYLREHFERWLALDPATRPTAAELARELEVLEEPERRRARRRTRLATALPLLSVAAVIAFLVTSVFRAHVTEREREAALARAQIEDLAEDLEATKQRSREVEERRRRIADEYERSQLSRQELSRRIARLESDQQRVDAQNRALTARIDATRELLGSAQQSLVARGEEIRRERAKLGELRVELEGERSARAASERNLAHQERLVAEAKRRHELLEDQKHELEARVEGLKASLDAERAKAKELETAMREAIEAKRRLERALERERERRETPPSSQESPAGADDTAA